MMIMASLSFVGCLYLLRTIAAIQLPSLPSLFLLHYLAGACLLLLDQRCKRYLEGLLPGAAEAQIERRSSRTQTPHI